jgi:hypothetical protein
MKIELINGDLKGTKKIRVIVSSGDKGVSTFVDASLFDSKEFSKFIYELETALNSCIKEIK